MTDRAFPTPTCLESDHPTESQLLGPDGRSLRYKQRPRVGFDLRPAAQRGSDDA